MDKEKKYVGYIATLCYEEQNDVEVFIIGNLKNVEKKLNKILNGTGPLLCSLPNDVYFIEAGMYVIALTEIHDEDDLLRVEMSDNEYNILGFIPQNKPYVRYKYH